jgi:hypothetical protein
MSFSSFLDKKVPPSEAELETVLGAALARWQALVHYLLYHYDMPGELTYGGKKYGWCLWFRRSGKSLLTLYPQRDGLVAQVVLGRDQVEKALKLQLGAHVAQILDNTPQLHDGRWLFIPVETEEDVSDVKALLGCKKRVKR